MKYLIFLILCCQAHAFDYYYESDKGNESELSDQDVTRKIKERLRLSWSEFWYQHVSVEVRHGVVTLQGTVNTFDDKDTVESLVKNSDGVKNLISRLRVQEKPKTYPSDYAATTIDADLNRRIRDQMQTILLGSNIKDIHLNTSNGEVTLEGSINNLTDQEKLIVAIRKIDGVVSVTSLLKIKNLQERQTHN